MFFKWFNQSAVEYLATCLPADSVVVPHSPAEILVPLENETVVLGDVAHFFCRIQGRYGDLRLRIGGRATTLDFTAPGNLIITTENGTSVDDISFTNISINITASKTRNNTLLECYDKNIESSSKATLTIKGMHRKNTTL